MEKRLVGLRLGGILVFLVAISTWSAAEEPETPGQSFLREHLDRLLDFKDAPKFREVGFGIGHEYSQWLKTLEARRDDPSFSVMEKIAAGDLITLGLEYVGTQGAENDYTRFARKEIEKIIARPESPSGDSKETYAEYTVPNWTVLGVWNESYGIKVQTIVERSESKYRIRWVNTGEPTRVKSLAELEKRGDYFYRIGSAQGDHFRILPSGELGCYDDDGHIDDLKPVK